MFRNSYIITWNWANCDEYNSCEKTDFKSFQRLTSQSRQSSTSTCSPSIFLPHSPHERVSVYLCFSLHQPSHVSCIPKSEPPHPSIRPHMHECLPASIPELKAHLWCPALGSFLHHKEEQSSSNDSEKGFTSRTWLSIIVKLPVAPSPQIALHYLMILIKWSLMTGHPSDNGTFEECCKNRIKSFASCCQFCC